MNQILFTKNNKFSLCKKNSRIYIFLLVASIFILIILYIFLFIKTYKNIKNEQIAQKLGSSYSISTLYSDSIDASSLMEKKDPFVIGIIKIDKINVNYSILSTSNDDLLDISVCRFAGPLPNEIGNLCIAGHNYVDYKFFSRINELKINDIIKIFDLKGNFLEYKIFNIYESNPSDTSCTNQNTNGLKIVTLITCNNVNGKRLIIQAKEII